MTVKDDTIELLVDLAISMGPSGAYAPALYSEREVRQKLKELFQWENASLETYLKEKHPKYLSLFYATRVLK